MNTPQSRISHATSHDVDDNGDYVLYWMTAFRRGQWNFSLQRAVEWARELKKPLVILEALRCDYRWASDRLHRFVIDGMVDNAAFFARKPVTYYPYVEPEVDAGKGLLAALADRASVVVGDDYPCFFLPKMVEAVVPHVPVGFELVDSNGLFPMRATERVFARAYDFRRFLQKHLVDHLEEMPEPDPLAGSRLAKLTALDESIEEQWPAADLAAFSKRAGLEDLPIDHQVEVSPLGGGSKEARRVLRSFVKEKLDKYATERNQPELDVSSGLSPYLHAGHISAHEVFAEVTAVDSWRPTKISSKVTGKAQGWWGASEAAESFLDELITWRELGFNMCAHRDDYDQFASLPDWSRRTLDEHAGDTREYVYTLEEFEQASTHDPLWNAAQMQLVREGRIHNYLRMLWGKKVLEWSATAEEALETLIELNNKYALDGRDPNSYSGIFWCLGRYDRAWGPERPIFGKVRYMSSENTARKVRVSNYIEEYQPAE